MIRNTAPNLSVALATYNESANLFDCLNSIKNLADEIIIVDGSSSDNTVEIAEKFGARVIVTDNPPIFHINKQKALEQCRGKWILQLDADEIVSDSLASEIKKIINLSDTEIETYQQNLPQRKLFIRHQKLLEKRDGNIGSTNGQYNAFFVPRLNYFLGKYLRHGGVYPDGVIRLVRNGYAHFPAKDVHEQIVVDGRVGWLNNDLIHMADKTFSRYLQRNSRYIDLLSIELKNNKVDRGLFGHVDYILIRPISWFFSTVIRHKGIMDGCQGIVFSFFSALRFPRAYYRYLKSK